MAPQIKDEAKNEIKDSLFRQYDIRGEFGKDLTTGFAKALGAGYAEFLFERLGKKELKVSIGRDVRLSSNALRNALIEGLAKSGIDCVDIGECPTPLQYFSLHSLNLDGGIMITGSHNPPEYNGFKVSVGKETIHGQEIQELKTFVKKAASEESQMSREGKPTPREGTIENFDIISEYTNFHEKGFSKTLTEAQKSLKRPIKIVCDAGNGTGGLVAPKLLEKLGCEVTSLFCETDGRFPNHHPDPTVVANLQDLIKKVKETGSDFGIGYDGDADRIGVVDEKGGIIWGDLLMVIFARSILEKLPGATIVGEVKCSQIMYDEIKRLGGNPVMWKTGHSLIKSRMKELKAAMAGEMSGHIFFADRYFGFDDAVYSSCRLAEILVEKRKKDPGFAFSMLLSGLPKTFVTPEIRIECPDDEKFEVAERLKQAIKKTGDAKIRGVVDIDGLRVIFEGGWGLVRASNTQPVLVMRFEAESQELLDKFKTFVYEELKSVWPGFKAPK
ncbi:MAG TPA: phosphomannomutase/phosphoglucomutase [Thermodesulfobacteriota bacterium]|nr:phosphomannomutase/phosphoglucomutase [Thermodesulfobacteriota bacterium]